MSQDSQSVGDEGKVRRTGTGYEVFFERRLRHQLERVWPMLTQPDRIATWFVRTEIEPRVGGKIVEHHDHVGVSMSGRVTRYEPPRVLAHTWGEEYATDGVPDHVLWELFPDGEDTRLTLTHRFTRLEGAQGSMAGWHILLDVLADVLAGGDPEAHAPPRGTFRDDTFSVTKPGRGHWTRHEELEQAYRRVVDQVAP